MLYYEGILGGVKFRAGGVLDDGRVYDAKLTLQFLENVKKTKKIAGIDKDVVEVTQLNFVKTMSDTQLLSEIDKYNNLIGKKVKITLIPSENLNLSFSDVELIK